MKRAPAKKKRSTKLRKQKRGKLLLFARVPSSGGRPSVYDPKFATQVIELMAQGLSLTAFAGVIGVARDTVYAWAKSNPDFSDALAKARAARTLYWESRLLTAGKDARAVIFALRNACSDEWKDKSEVDLTHTVKPPEEWGEKEVAEELARRGALPKKT